MFSMIKLLDKHSTLIALAKKYRRWVFGHSRKGVVASLVLGFSTLIISALAHALLSVFMELYIIWFMLLLAAFSLGWLCDAVIELARKNRSIPAGVLLLTMGFCGLVFSGSQIKGALSSPFPFGIQHERTK